MDANRTWMLVGIFAGVLAAAILLGTIGLLFGEAATAWIDWLTIAALLAVMILIAVTRWRHGGWAEVRVVWWLFAVFAVYGALRIASFMGIRITDLLGQ